MWTLETIAFAALMAWLAALALTGVVSHRAARRATSVASDEPAPGVAATAGSLGPQLVAHIADSRANLHRRPAPVKAAELLVTFMQEQGCTGYFTVPEIDEFWRWYSSHNGLDELHPMIVRAELSAIPGVYIGLRRLNGPSFRDVKRRAGTDRATLYRIPEPPLLDRRAPDRRQTGGGQVPEMTRQKRSASGNRPANPKKRVLPGTFAEPTPSAKNYRTLGDVAASHGQPLLKVA